METPFDMVFSRSIVAPAISMSGHLYSNAQTGAILGWLAITWTERGAMPPLRPKMHWVSKEDGKARHDMLDRGLAQPLDEDIEIESHRAVFIRATLTLWEQEYLEKISG